MLSSRRYSRAAVRVVACLVLAPALLAGTGSASSAAPEAPLLVVSSDYTQWSENHAFLYAPGGRLRALSLGEGATASPDGRLVGFVRDRDLWTVDAAGRGARRIATLDGKLAFGESLLWSRDGRHVAVTLVDPSSLLYHTDLVDIATGDDARLDSIAAAFSPDGASVAYVADPPAGLVIADARGANERVVAPGWEPERGIAWSADGRWIAFVAHSKDGRAQVVFVHPDGSGVHELGAGAVFPSALSWSSDGRLAWLASPRLEVATPEGGVRTLARIQGIGWPEPAPAWSSDGRLLAVRARGSAVALVPAAGGHVRVVHLPGAATALAGGPSWLGNRLVVTGHKARSDAELALLRADGTRLRALTSNGFADRDPAWAPDGRTIAFVRFGTKRQGIYTIGVASHTIRRLTHGPDRAPAFSPDGSSIAFVRSKSIQLLDLRTRHLRQLATTRIWPRQLSWTPDSGSIVFGDEYGVRRVDVSSRDVQAIDVGEFVVRPLLSPDGQEIAFLSSRDERYFRDPGAWGVFVSSLDGATVRRLTSNDKFGPRSWSPDQSLLLACDGYRLELVDVATGNRRLLLDAGHTAEAAFAPTSGPAR
jgi:Tol biopolymer transport system component